MVNKSLGDLHALNSKSFVLLILTLPADWMSASRPQEMKTRIESKRKAKNEGKAMWEGKDRKYLCSKVLNRLFDRLRENEVWNMKFAKTYGK